MEGETKKAAMSDTETSDTLTRIQLGDREIILVGTAHVSRDSVEEVSRVIRSEQPGRVCVEIDAARYRTMTEGQSWASLDIGQVLRQKKGFLLLANLVLASFQRRIGAELGVQPGEEMKAAVRVAEELGIPFTFADREVTITLRRAWAASSLWNKNKMLAALLSSAVTREKLNEEEIERLKKRSALDDMMEELAGFLPSVKQVLIDERDRYLATRIFEVQEQRVVAVVGAGHVKGITAWLERLAKGSESLDISALDEVSQPGRARKLLPWIIPAAIAALIVAGFFRGGWHGALTLLWKWIVVNGGLAAIGSLIAFAHPLTLLVAFVGAPIATLNPFVGIGMLTGVVEAFLRKPRVSDFESLSDDIQSLRGFYRNRVTHILLVFLLSSVGGMIGNFIALPYLVAHL